MMFSLNRKNFPVNKPEYWREINSYGFFFDRVCFPFNIFIRLTSKKTIRWIMADLFTDLLIYIAIGIMTFAMGAILGYQILMMYYMKRFMVIAKQCFDVDSVIPIIDELARET